MGKVRSIWRPQHPSATEQPCGDLTQDQMDTAIIVALCLSIVGNIINAWGMIYMKIGHEAANSTRLRAACAEFMRLQELKDTSEENHAEIVAAKNKAKQAKGTAELSGAFLKECKWWLGMALYGVGSFMHVASLGFGPSALLNPMEGLTLVANTLSAPSCLGEAITQYDIWGTIVIIGGTLVVVFFGPHNSEEYTADEILDRFSRAPFIIWSACIWTATGVGYAVSKYIEHINERDGIRMDGTLNPRGSIFLALMYTSTKGVMGGYTMLFGKMFAEVAAESGEGDNQFVKWETYLFFALFLLFNFLMEYWRQKALNLFSTMYCVPLFQVTLVVFAVFTGAIFFDEFAEISTFYLIMFFVGVIIICIGVVILSVMTESRAQVPVRRRMAASFQAVWFTIILRNLARPKRKDTSSSPPDSPPEEHTNRLIIDTHDIVLADKDDAIATGSTIVDSGMESSPERSPNSVIQKDGQPRSPIPWERAAAPGVELDELHSNSSSTEGLVLAPVG